MSKSDSSVQARKELLKMKAELERMELSGNVYRAKMQLSWLPVVKKTLSVMTGRTLGSLGPLSSLGAQTIHELMRINPILGAVASAALVRYRKPISTGLLRAGMGAAMVAAAMYMISKSRNPAIQEILRRNRKHDPIEDVIVISDPQPVQDVVDPLV